MRIAAAAVAALCVICSIQRGAATEQSELPGVWSTNLSIASGAGAQGWEQFSEDGAYNRLVMLPKPADDSPAACQIATGRWSAAPSGQSLIVTYTIEDYQPKSSHQQAWRQLLRRADALATKLECAGGVTGYGSPVLLHRAAPAG